MLRQGAKYNVSIETICSTGMGRLAALPARRPIPFETICDIHIYVYVASMFSRGPTRGGTRSRTVSAVAPIIQSG